MIEINITDLESPFHEFLKLYKNAEFSNQKNIEAACLATVSDQRKPRTRYVNIKYINDNEIIFFSNYTSAKAIEINSNKNIALTFFWSSANIQIRIEGKINKLSGTRSDQHWKIRSKYKNALAISSDQSSLSGSYQEVIDNYNNSLNLDDLSVRPNYWGGYVIQPSYFEFWQGHESRINQRTIFKRNKTLWSKYYLQP
jgi:pyridoxamine 5'-phosphate oxidase